MSTAGQQPCRLPVGGRVDRERPVPFEFDGRKLFGLAGDTLASALLANGIRLVGRSFKYHRPRGILSAGPEEPNALVELRTGARREPNTRATQVELYDGLVACAQNAWPSLSFDLRAAYEWFSPLLGAGFYYKTFMWPAAFWEKLYEPLIRKSAGLGRAAGQEDPDSYERTTVHCDVLVVGAGPTGLAAALRAARAGARVVLCEQDFELGGRLLGEQAPIAGVAPGKWLDDTVDELLGYEDVMVLRRTTVFATYDHGVFAAVERVWDHVIEPPPFEPRQRLCRIVTRASILATGAIEQPLVFENNDRPGIMLSASVRTYLNRFGVLPGRKVVVLATDDDAAQTALDIFRAGGAIAAIVDPRPDSSPAMRAAAETVGTRLFAGSVVRRALGDKSGVRSVLVTGTNGEISLACDLVAVSGGWSPAIHLASHLGHRPKWDERTGSFLMTDLPRGMRVAGAAAGTADLAQCLRDGARSAVATLEDLGFRDHLDADVANGPNADAGSVQPNAQRGTGPWRVPSKGAKCFVDFQNDVTVNDIEQAARDGFRRAEHMKRYTTLGMATDQGKTANLNAAAIMAGTTGQELERLGTTTFRPPFTPVPIGIFAGHSRGRHFRPTRRAPTHQYSADRGAIFVEAGEWLRAQCYPATGEDILAAAIRESRSVRERVGFCDVSTFGKIEILGKDVPVFLDRVYANTFSTLAAGRVRYGLMLREDGIVLDDGTTARLSEDRWYMTTTTANAGRVLQHLEYCRQVLWPELDVRLVNVTDAWAQVALAGPRSREVLQRLVDSGFDVSDEALPYMAVREGSLRGGIPARVFRISFSGERAFEIAVPARWGHFLMEAIASAGAPEGIAPYGTEALSILRIEKGHVAGGELNGQTSAADLGLGRMVSAKKDCIGRVLAGRPAFLDPARPTLVGLKSRTPDTRFDGGAHLFESRESHDLAHDLGYVTSVAFSAAVGSWIGLGLLANGRDRLGQVVHAYDPVRGKTTELEVCEPCFVDPSGERLRG